MLVLANVLKFLLILPDLICLTKFCHSMLEIQTILCSQACQVSDFRSYFATGVQQPKKSWTSSGHWALSRNRRPPVVLSFAKWPPFLSWAGHRRSSVTGKAPRRPRDRICSLSHFHHERCPRLPQERTMPPLSHKMSLKHVETLRFFDLRKSEENQCHTRIFLAATVPFCLGSHPFVIAKRPWHTKWVKILRSIVAPKLSLLETNMYRKPAPNRSCEVAKFLGKESAVFFLEPFEFVGLLWLGSSKNRSEWMSMISIAIIFQIWPLRNAHLSSVVFPGFRSCKQLHLSTKTWPLSWWFEASNQQTLI